MLRQSASLSDGKAPAAPAAWWQSRAEWAGQCHPVAERPGRQQARLAIDGRRRGGHGCRPSAAAGCEPRGRPVVAINTILLLKLHCPAPRPQGPRSPEHFLIMRPTRARPCRARGHDRWLAVPHSTRRRCFSTMSQMLPPSVLLYLAVSGVALAAASPSTTGSGVVRALSTLQRLDCIMMMALSLALAGHQQPSP
jgi:hypothetical protein